MIGERQVVIFDGDDTLWSTQPIYQRNNQAFYGLMETEGFDRAETVRLFEQRNRELRDLVQLSMERRGMAMADTYKLLCEQAEVPVKPAIVEQVMALAKQVYSEQPEEMADLHAVLSSLARRFDLVFYSAGGDEAQRRRLSQLGLERYFGNRVYIVTRKDDDMLRCLLSEHRINSKTAWMVGNSPHLEINPAIRLGLRAVWMYTDFWKEDLEDIADGQTFVGFSLREAEAILTHASGFPSKHYRPASPDAVAAQRDISQMVERTGASWLVGSSPKLDINPALSCKLNTVWLASLFDSAGREPFAGRTFVAFSPEGAERIIARWHRTPQDPSRTIWRVRDGLPDRGGSIVIE